MTQAIRVAPHSREAEESVIGSLLLDKDTIIALGEFLRPEDFYDDRHRIIYESALELYEARTPIDILTISEKLKKKKSLKSIGGSAYLIDLANKVPTAAHVEHYGKIVKETATKRALMKTATRLVELSSDEGLEIAELLDKAESEVFSLTQKHVSHAFAPVKDALAASFDRLDELHKQQGGLRGVPTGFKELDDTLAGLQHSNLIILAARPSVGKTSLALNIAHHVGVKAGRPVGFFSLEMSREELVDRLLVAEADIDAWKLKTGKLSEDDFTSLSNAMGVLAEAPIYIDDTPALSILEMRTRARRLQVEHGLDLIIMDYLQLARSRGLENRVQEVSEISQGLKNIARELKVPVIALSQLSRSVEQRGEKRPQLSDLRDSGCLLGDSLIVRVDTGKQVPIESLVGQKNIPILAMNDNLKLIPTKINKVFESGEKMVYEMTLKSGKVIRASGNHPFFKLSGWIPLDALSKGDRIATPRNLPINPQIQLINDNRLIVLAHLIGDGCYVKRQPLHYTNSDMELIEIVKDAAVAEFGIKPRIVPQENWYHLYLSASEKLARGKRNAIVRWLDEELGIYGQHAKEKYIPKVVFTQGKEKIALFLKHLWATDGCIHIYKKTKKKVTIYFGSSSQKLAQDVAHLLLRLGIISTITQTTKKGYGIMYNVHIYGKRNQLAFIEKVEVVGKKKIKLQEAKEFLVSIKGNPNNDVIPKDVWKYIKLRLTEKEITHREFQKGLGWSYNGSARYKNGIGRDRLHKIAEFLDDPYLQTLSNSDIYWDELLSIKKIGIKKVYDATVPKHANFIANDIIVHNSIEQDADVVMFLYREDDDAYEASQTAGGLNISLDIAKHRNGALKSLKFFFKGNRMRFIPRDGKHGKS